MHINTFVVKYLRPILAHSARIPYPCTKFRHDRWPSISWTLAEMANRKYLNQDNAESLLKYRAIDLLVQLYYYAEKLSLLKILNWL